MRYLIVVPLLVAFIASPAQAVGGDIAPGDFMGNCTLAFTLDGANGDVYMLTANHCVTKGQAVYHYGGITGPIWQEDGSTWIGLGKALDRTHLGTVVEVGGYGASGHYADDWALIKVRDAVEHRVVGQLRGAPAAWPTGVSGHNEAIHGDPLYHTGWGQSYQQSEILRETRFGLLLYQDPTVYGGYSPTFFGDSGGPVTDVRTGKAVGLVTGIGADRLGFSLPGDLYTGVNHYGASVEGVLAALADRGYDLTLRTA